jgi:hypothetical protein
VVVVKLSVVEITHIVECVECVEFVDVVLLDFESVEIACELVY